MDRNYLYSCRGFYRATITSTLFTIMLLVSPAFAQKGKPPPPPPSLSNAAIVYQSGSDLRVTNADGTNQVTVLANALGILDRSWSPDGNDIVFHFWGVQGNGIYRLSLNRSTGAIGPLTKLIATNPKGGGPAPAWSPVETPQGFKIAYADYEPGGAHTDIFLLDLATGQTQNLTNTVDVGDRHPSWSPDGNKLLVTVNQSYPYDLHILTLSCQENSSTCDVARRQSLLEQLAIVDPNSPLLSGEIILQAAWANTTNQIAVVARKSPQTNEIWIIEFGFNQADDLLVTGARNVTNTPDRAENYPSWSPDDSELIYKANFGNVCGARKFSGIVLRNADGSLLANGCDEQALIKDGGYLNWWRNAP